MGRFTGSVVIIVILGLAFLFSNNKKSINISSFANGVYFIKAYDTANNLLKTEKLIKQ